MARSARQDSGHVPGLSWGAYIDWVVGESGSLAAAAERLSARHAYRDDAQSIERALRRLRVKETGDGGKWGARVLATFGLPGASDERSRWMGAYHSRFTDLPVPVCEDLVRLHDRPPVSLSRASRVWLSLGHASCALRRNEADRARSHLQEARAQASQAPAEARAELLLTQAFIESRDAPHEVPGLLAQVGPLLDEVTRPHDRACLHARWVDQRAYELNRRAAGPSFDEVESLYASIATDDAPVFVLCRRANGLAYLRHRQGRSDEAAGLAREAATHAGDGGHVRLRAMALSMLARVSSGAEASDAHRRATRIAQALDDETLRFRLARIAPRR